MILENLSNHNKPIRNLWKIQFKIFQIIELFKIKNQRFLIKRTDMF